MKTRIKELRQEKNFTQESLANQIGTTQTALSKIESGISIPDAMLIINLSDAFQVSTDYILYQTEHRFSVDTLFTKYIYSLQHSQDYLAALQKFHHCRHSHLQNFINSIHLL